MKTFEEKYTAWIDGKLSGRELADFEAELATRDDAQSGKTEALKLGDLLREHYRGPELRNADFFNHQLMQRLGAEAAKESAPASRGIFSWTLPRMIQAGVLSLTMVAVLYFIAVPKGPVVNPTGDQYVAQILNSHSDDPAITATTIHSKDNGLTVLWLDGLDYVPADHER